MIASSSDELSMPLFAEVHAADGSRVIQEPEVVFTQGKRPAQAARRQLGGYAGPKKDFKIRIAHVCATFPPYAGGTGNVCYHNARVLAARGHEVHVFTTGGPGLARVESLDGMTVHRLKPVAAYGNVSVLPQLLWSLRGFDVIHCHYPACITGGELAALYAWLTKTCLVFTYHNDLVPTGTWRDAVFRLAAWSGRRALLSAQRVLFVSQGHAETNDMRALYHGQATCQILGNGVDTDLFRPAPDTTVKRQALALPGDGPVVGFVGALDMAHHYKGLEVLLEALATAALAHVHLVVAGDGELRVKYQRQAEQTGLAGRVLFYGQVPQEELPSLYQACDVVAHPSLAGESFALVVVESLACGVPVVAFDCPGIRSLVSGGLPVVLVERGNICELAGSIRSLLDDEVERRAIGEQGRNEIESHYRWDIVGSKLEEIYAQALAEGR